MHNRQYTRCLGIFEKFRVTEFSGTEQAKDQTTENEMADRQ